MTSNTDQPSNPSAEEPTTEPSAPNAPTKPEEVDPVTGTGPDDVPIDNPSG